MTPEMHVTLRRCYNLFGFMCVILPFSFLLLFRETYSEHRGQGCALLCTATVYDCWTTHDCGRTESHIFRVGSRTTASDDGRI